MLRPILTLLIVSAAAHPVSAANAKPNIVFIMADDLGYADLSCYGRRDYETPHLDRLAAEGTRYLDAYSNSPVCSATRTALITGRYQYRLPVGLEEPLSSRPVGLPPSQPTFPSLLRQAGYRTALVGKWHLGRLADYGPLQSGYEHFWGYRAGGVDYFTHAGMGGADLWDQDVPIEQDGYLTDLLGERALLQTLTRFPRLGSCTVKVSCDERFQRTAFYRRGHPMGGALVLSIRHQLP